MSNDRDEHEKIHCNLCGHATNHDLLTSRKNERSEPYDEHYHIHWSTQFDLYECRGCDELTLRRRYWFSEWNPGELDEVFYPPRVGRKLPNWAHKLDRESAELLAEVYTALHAGSSRIAMMGARALIDMVMLNEVGDAGSFARKLEMLESSGFLAAKHREVLDAALGVGSAAAHRGHKPKQQHVDQVMDIVEHLLQTTVLQAVAGELQAATPARPPRS